MRSLNNITKNSYWVTSSISHFPSCRLYNIFFIGFNYVINNNDAEFHQFLISLPDGHIFTWSIVWFSQSYFITATGFHFACCHSIITSCWDCRLPLISPSLRSTIPVIRHLRRPPGHSPERLFFMPSSTPLIVDVFFISLLIAIGLKSFVFIFAADVIDTPALNFATLSSFH